MPRVSIVVPTHNRPELLARALRSIYNQTYQDFEVLVVDDGSKPRAQEFLGEWLSKPNFKYLETNKDQGGAVTRNVGIKAASGEFVAFLDDDDEWLADKLRKQVTAFDECSNKVSLVFSGVAAYDNQGRHLYSRLPGVTGLMSPFKRLLRKCFIWTSSLMIRRSYIDQGFIFDEDLKKNQEWDLELRLAKVSQFYALNEPLTRLNIGESEQMGGKKNLPNIINGYELFLDKHQADYESEPKALALRLFHLGYLYWDNNQPVKARSLWFKSWQLNKLNFIPLKHWLVIGWGKYFYRQFKDWYKKTSLSKWQLFHRDWQRGREIIKKFFPNQPEAVAILDSFCRSDFFKSRFSFGHSGDFDVMMLYTITKLTKPAVVVETGVASGRSSAAILTALKENNFGELYSIDLPQFYNDTNPETYLTSEGNNELKGFVPNGQTPGWLVGDELRSRWHLILGDSKVELGKLLAGLASVDIFYHDSDHSYESMYFEFESIWPKLLSGGFLLSDDTKWNKSWSDFNFKVKPAIADAYRGFGLAKK